MILSPDLTTILRTAQSDAERRVARLLVGVGGDDNAVAFHSVKLRSHRRKSQAEADFVVLWKGVVVVIEVKGGGVRHADGKWWSIDRRGDWNPLKESPMDQADGAKFALRDILHEDGIGWYPDQHAVITPDIDDLDSAIGWFGTHWLSREDMSVVGLQEALDQIIQRASSPNRNAKLARAADIRERLFGEFSRLPRIDVQRGAVIEEQNRATSGQARYLEGLARNSRILVVGGAGTGKSLALSEGAKQEADQGRSVLITFRSPGLLDYFSALVHGTSIDVRPFTGLRSDRTYDVVFIDEAQDLMTAEDMDTFDKLIQDGRESGRWRMFLDPNNQANVDGKFDDDVYQLVLADAVTFALPINVRNTRPIVHVVQSYLGADVGDPGIVHGEPLNWHDSDAADTRREATNVAEQLIRDGTHPKSIWIIDTTSDEPPRTTDGGFVVTSPKYAKGLEADRVIVCGLPSEFDDLGNAAFYVAVTRARVALHIVVDAADRKRLKSLLRTKLGHQ
ncbi:ATP-binding domain-containing protein [Aeromicrobium panaciterrae]|uniref:NERD domain-containing protein n=1 Tax=Aeromicrobium panaciterrae TaxID=363861 RepID=UPI0031DAA0FE